MRSLLVARGEDVYKEHKERLERDHLGMIVAIEVESREIAGIGRTLEEAYEEAIRKYPKKRFYFRKVGPCAAPGYLFRVIL